MLFLFTNSLLYLFALLLGFKRFKEFNVYTFLLCWFSFVAVLGFITFCDGTYEKTFGTVDVEDFDFFYFLLAFLLYLFLFTPIRRLASKDVDYDHAPISGIFLKFVYIHYFLLFVLLCLLVPMLYKTISTGLVDAYFDKMNGELSYPIVVNVLKIHFQGAYYFLFVYTGYLLTIQKYHLIALLGFFEIILFVFMISLIEASRGGVFFSISDVVFIYLIFQNRMQNNAKKIIKIVFSVSMIIILSAIWTLTVQRFDSGDNKVVMEQVERYFGESFPNYGYRVMGQAKQHLYGERFAPYIYELIYDKKPYKPTGMSDFQNYYELKSNIPILNFKTLVGDFYTEFGLVWGVFWLLTIGILFSSFIHKRGKRVHLYVIMILFYYFQFCFIGANDNIKTLADYGMLSKYIFWIILMRFLEKNSNSKLRELILGHQKQN